MTFDELQKDWQSQKGGFQLNIDSNILLKQVRRNKLNFEAAIFWRDVREVGGCILLFIYFMYMGLKTNVWSMLLLAFILLGVGSFMIIDRIVQKKKHPELAESLTGCIESSLAQVAHQIWLLKNVLWWYLLPPGIGIGVSLFHVAFMIGEIKKLSWGIFVVYPICCLLFFWGVYHLNQWAVRKELIPRKEELEQLLNSLQNTGE